MSERPETILQKAVALILDAEMAEGKLVWWHTKNAEKMRPHQAKFWEQMGRKAGVPDVIIVQDGKWYLIELKAQSGSLTPKQKLMHTKLKNHQILVAVCRSVQEVINYLTKHGVLK